MTLLNFATGLLMAASVVSGQGTSSAMSTAPLVRIDRSVLAEAKFLDLNRRESVAAYVQEYFSETPILADIAFCESTYRQVGLDGKVLRGLVNSDDVGVMQINEYYHADTAESLGYDIHTIDGNLAFAKYLYDKYGVKPWKSSAKCWNDA